MTAAIKKLRTRTLVVVLVIGVLMLLMGAVAIPLGFQAIMEAILDQMMVISPKSPIYPEWQDPTLPIYTRFYFFDLQNPDEVLRGGKPSVVEIGPYSYKMTMPRENITFNPNDTVTSLQTYTYIFDRSQSVGDENDTFMTTNMPFWSVAYFVRDESSLIQLALSAFLDLMGEKPFMPLTVGDLIWGYDEPLFKWLHENLPDYPFPPGFESQFGFLLGRNNTALGVYTSFTGVGNKSKVNKVDRFDGRSSLTYWKSESANMINGSDGMMYHMGIEEDEVLYLFHPDLCRSMPYTYVKDDVLEGVPLKMFSVAPWAYQNSSTYPLNAGFNITTDEVPRGLLRVDPCRFGTPLALSNPHFFNGDPSLAGGVHGLSPPGQDADKHRNYFSIDPILGMPFKLRMRLQLNQYVQQVENIGQTQQVKTMYIPALWFEESVTANDEVIGYYDMGIKLTAIVAQVIQYLCIAIGAIIMVVFLPVGLYRCMARPRKSIRAESNASTYQSTNVFDNTIIENTVDKEIQEP